MKSIQPRKQRKAYYNAPLHKKRKWIASHLAENLLLKYDARSIPLIEGDTVKVMRGSYKGHEDKVAKVHVRKGIVEIEGLTMIKADGKKIARPIDPSNVLITKLNLTDKWRRNRLESNLTDEVKKEIEAEAQEQLKEREEEQKKQEELEKEEAKADEPSEKEDLEEEEPEPTVKKTPAKTQPVKQEQKKKTPTKKTTASKKPVKKSTVKSSSKKEEKHE
jgi:large subunit ribosomal protein L24